MEHLIHPWGPIVSPDSKILILGSFPSVKSREVSFFYGHPQNRFWPMLARIYDEPLPLSVEEKTALILRHELALWDSIGECDITASADASVRNARPVDIERVTSVATIQRVLCNGALSAKLYTRYLKPVVGLDCIAMPSTSPANASWRPERLAQVWAEQLRLKYNFKKARDTAHK